MKRYLEKQLDVARERGGEGLIAELVRVGKDGGQISRNEMVSMLFLLLFAGHETTTHFASFWQLADHQQALRQLSSRNSALDRAFSPRSAARSQVRNQARCASLWRLEPFRFRGGSILSVQTAAGWI